MNQENPPQNMDVINEGNILQLGSNLSQSR